MVVNSIYNHTVKFIGIFALAFGVLLFNNISAITDGELDGNGHPYVGLMVAQDASGTPLWRCSGTLISPTVYLTAGHCTEPPAARAQIWFDADVESGIPGNGYPFTGDVGGTTFTHPQYDPILFFLHDLGIVVLDSPVILSQYGALPSLDELAIYKGKGVKGNEKREDRVFTAVGYGRQKSFPDAASWKIEAQRVRMVAYPWLINYYKDFSLILSNNQNSGGTCFGDSGGPNFIGSSNIIGGVTSFAKNGNCAGQGGVYRIDQQDDLDFINTFL